MNGPKKGHPITVRLLPGERQEIELAAYIAGVSLSEFARRCTAAIAKQVITQYHNEPESESD